MTPGIVTTNKVKLNPPLLPKVSMGYNTMVSSSET